MDHIDRPRIHRSEHEKIIHKLSHHEQQDLIATPWQIWERKEIDEYAHIEPEYYEEEEETEEQGGDYVWIKGGVIEKERERQAAIYGKGLIKESGNEIMQRAENTPQKRRQMIADNEEANLAHIAHRQEMYRQGFCNYTNTKQSGNARKICKREIQRGARLAGTYRQQLNDIRSLRRKPAQTHLQSIHTKINIRIKDT
jgi:hypothetical protein